MSRQYPVIFDKCPLCGCKERLIEEAVNEEIAKGRINPGMEFGLEAPTASVLWDQTKPSLQAPGIIPMKDICAECGFPYYRKIQKVEMPVTRLIPPKPQQPPFLRGM